MRLTRKKAIELCIELWTWCAKTGESKRKWPGWKKYGNAWGDCWFCEYDEQRPTNPCRSCPLKFIFRKDGCTDDECYYKSWENAQTPETRKKYARLFLKQIRKCK